MDSKQKKLSFAALGIVTGLAFLLWQKKKNGPKLPPPETVSELDLERYAGTWYEIARLPNRFQKFDDIGAQDTYTLKKNSYQVSYRWFPHHFENKEKHMKGKIYRPDETEPGKFKFKLMALLNVDYWVVDLGADYNYSVISTPDRKGVWIMSRNPFLDDTIYQGILLRLEQRGWDTSQLQRIPQLPLEVIPS